MASSRYAAVSAVRVDVLKDAAATTADRLGYEVFRAPLQPRRRRLSVPALVVGLEPVDEIILHRGRQRVAARMQPQTVGYIEAL